MDRLFNEIRAMIIEGLPTAAKLTDAGLATLEKLSQEVIGVYFERLQSPVLRAALAVLWLSLHKENFPFPCWLTTFGVLLARQASRDGHSSCPVVQEFHKPPTTRSLEFDILNWTISRRIFSPRHTEHAGWLFANLLGGPVLLSACRR